MAGEAVTDQHTEETSKKREEEKMEEEGREMREGSKNIDCLALQPACPSTYSTHSRNLSLNPQATESNQPVPTQSPGSPLSDKDNTLALTCSLPKRSL